MHRSTRSAVVLLQVIALGCGNLNSIHRPLDINDGKGVLIDIKQRAILVRKNPLTVCAEASPDALAAYATQISAAVNDPAKLSAALGVATQENAAFVGLRTQSIQLLRDSLYRACEMYLNKAIDDLQYQILVRRYQKYTVALLAIEQLTGATRAQAAGSLTPTVTPTPTPPSTPTPGSAAGTNTKTPTATPTAAASTQKSRKIDGSIAPSTVFAALVATRPSTGAARVGATPTPTPTPSATATSTPAKAEGAPSAPPARDMAAVADVVREIVIKILDTDDEGQLCLADLKAGTLKEPLLSICTDYVRKRNEVYLRSLAGCVHSAPPASVAPAATPTVPPPPAAAPPPSPIS